MKPLHYVLIAGGTLLLAAWLLHAWPKPSFESIIPELVEVLDCDCEMPMDTVFRTPFSLRVEIIDAIAAKVVRKQMSPETAIRCADHLISLLTTLPEDTESLRTIQQALIVKLYAYQML
ncbi:MAG: hypothetical protein AAFQ87_24600, partial [Bacteroidota bacterium]